MKLLLFTFLVGLYACATPKPSEVITQVPSNDISVAEVKADEDLFTEAVVRWGGRIIESKRLTLDESSTKIGSAEDSVTDTKNLKIFEVEILSFPVTADGRPLAESAAGGRFAAVIEVNGKKMTFNRNRYITVVGTVLGIEEKRLQNGSVLKIPRIKVTDFYQWSSAAEEKKGSGVTFGIGIGVGTRGSGAGVGISF